MKLYYQNLTKEEKNKIKEKFLETDKTSIYKKAGKIIILANIGILISLLSLLFDFVYKMGWVNYLMDSLLFVFSGLFVIVMKNIQMKQLNTYALSQKKAK